VPFEKEILSLTDHINEYLMVSLRTMWGCDINFLKEKYGYDITKDEQNLPRLLNYQANELLTIENEKIMLTFKGKLLADEIAVNLFVQ
jgi:oxygen-independent coproporphyrinogen-3 oxidase